MENLNYLSALMLELDNEKMMYEETDKVLSKKQNDVFKKYKIGININQFLYDSNDKIGEDFKKMYDEFISKKVNDHSTYGDYFSVDLESVNEKGFKYSIKTSGDFKYVHPKQAECKLYQIFSALKSNGEKTITTIVQYFEEFLSVFLRILILQKPEAYLFDKQIKYSEIIEKNIADVKKEILTQEIRDLMYDVISTLEKIDNIHKYNITNGELFEKYKEINAHRNIIVHNRGRVNSDYNRNVSKKYQKEVGKQIQCELALIEEDILTIEELAFLLCYLHGENENDHDMLESVAFTALCDEKWEFCKFAYDLLKRMKTISNELKATYTANYLLSLKKIDGLEKTKELIEKFDVSGMEMMYHLAKDLLLENYSEVVEELEEIFEEKIFAEHVEGWPIFADFRNTEEYAKFVESHPTAFSDFNAEVENIEEDSSDSEATSNKTVNA